MRVDKTFAEIDSICEYIPIVSAVSNLVDLFLKCVVKCLPNETVKKNRYWTHIRDKRVGRCIQLIVFSLIAPILSNIVVFIHDRNKYNKEKVECQKAQQEHKKLAAGLAVMAAKMNGSNVTIEEMMPVEDANQLDLWMSCARGDVARARELLAKKVSPNFYHAGNRPLVSACQSGKAEIVRLLIENGAEVNTPDRLGITPFEAACSIGNLEIVRLLQPKISDINQKNVKGITFLMKAVAMGYKEVAAFLVENGADPRIQCVDRSDALTCALLPHDRDEMLPLLFAKDENIDERKYKFKRGPFHAFDFTHFFSPTIENLTPLLYAALFGATKCVKYLLPRSNLDLCDSLGHTVLHHAVKDVIMLRAVLEKRKGIAFVDQKNNAGATALLYSTISGKVESALLLLELGADPFMASDNGKNPFITACEKDLVPVIEYIKQSYPAKITAEMKLEMDKFEEINAPKRSQVKPVEKPDASTSLIDTGFKLMHQGLDSMKSNIDEEIQRPLTAMELIYGRIVWPV